MSRLVLEYQGTASLQSSISRAIQREINMLSLAVRISGEALRTFEQRYDMPSEYFFERMERGEFGDSEDFIEWAGEYELLLRTQDELHELQTITICS
ncbi:MAG: hypothetical protein GY801_00075 [bacterium]|nr:hypothetical protein [bacterium]